MNFKYCACHARHEASTFDVSGLICWASHAQHSKNYRSFYGDPYMGPWFALWWGA